MLAKTKATNIGQDNNHHNQDHPDHDHYNLSHSHHSNNNIPLSLHHHLHPPPMTSLHGLEECDDGSPQSTQEIIVWGADKGPGLEKEKKPSMLRRENGLDGDGDGDSGGGVVLSDYDSTKQGLEPSLLLNPGPSPSPGLVSNANIGSPSLSLLGSQTTTTIATTEDPKQNGGTAHAEKSRTVLSIRDDIAQEPMTTTTTTTNPVLALPLPLSSRVLSLSSDVVATSTVSSCSLIDTASPGPLSASLCIDSSSPGSVSAIKQAFSRYPSIPPSPIHSIYLH